MRFRALGRGEGGNGRAGRGSTLDDRHGRSTRLCRRSLPGRVPLIWGTSGYYHNQDVTGVYDGDTIEGKMVYNNNVWRVITADTTRNLATGDLSAANMLPNSNVLLEVYLESWTSGLPRFMPGPTPFYNFIVKDTNGANCYPSSISTDIRSGNYSYLTLGISNTTYWPNTITNPLVLTTS